MAQLIDRLRTLSKANRDRIEKAKVVAENIAETARAAREAASKEEK